MGKTRSAGWIGGTALLVVVILVAAYFLQYKPRAEAAAATLAQAEQTRAENDNLAIQVAQLREDFQHLDEYKEDLAAFALQIPSRADLADMTQMIREIADANAVTILELSPGVPIDVTVPTAPIVVTDVATPPTTEEGAPGDAAVDQAGETAADAEGAADAADDTQAPAAPTLPSAPTQIEGFIAVPVMIKVLGPYPNVVAFLDGLQIRDGRLFLASDIDATRQKAAEASQGRPAVADGDLELVISGFVYVLLDPAASMPVEVGEDGEELPEPVIPSSDRNPFVPLVPSAG